MNAGGWRWCSLESAVSPAIARPGPSRWQAAAATTRRPPYLAVAVALWLVPSTRMVGVKFKWAILLPPLYRARKPHPARARKPHPAQASKVHHAQAHMALLAIFYNPTHVNVLR